MNDCGVFSYWNMVNSSFMIFVGKTMVYMWWTVCDMRTLSFLYTAFDFSRLCGDLLAIVVKAENMVWLVRELLCELLFFWWHFFLWPNVSLRVSDGIMKAFSLSGLDKWIINNLPHDAPRMFGKQECGLWQCFVSIRYQWEITWREYRSVYDKNCLFFCVYRALCFQPFSGGKTVVLLFWHSNSIKLEATASFIVNQNNFLAYILITHIPKAIIPSL